jgi:DNA phosphorothioation-associated putative methyltransferase
VHYPKNERTPADVVNLGYVINVIENLAERAAALRQAWSLAQKVLVVAARLIVEAALTSQTTPHEDGCLTRLGTFQKYYEQRELRDWIDNILSVASVPAAPGVFYIFRDPELRQAFLASRYRRQIAAPRQRQSDILFEQHKALFESLMAFITARGRLPDESELQESSLICQAVGSLNRAFGIVRRVTGEEAWSRIREERIQDLLIYLALACFDGRPRFSQLSRDLQLDIRAFFSTYNRACDAADKLLFSAGNREAVEQACRASPVGKITPTALYIHVSAFPHLPSILRVYEGCARAYIGAVEGANIIKLHRGTPQVSYLSYPDFERDPHPALVASLIVPLQTFRIQYRDYRDSQNPPILHRKEEFLPLDHPLRSRFARLTVQEERQGLYERPETIGTREGWERALADRNICLSGHRLLRRST